MSDYILVYPVIKESSSLVFNFGFLILTLLVLIFLYLGGFYIYTNTNQQEISIKEFKSTWGTIYDWLDKVMMMPIYGLCFVNIFCQGNFVCGSATHIILVILSVVNLILLTILEVMYAYLFFNFTFKLKDTLSRNPSSYTNILFGFKLILIFANVSMDLTQAGGYTSFLILHLAKGILMLVESLTSFPYHSKNVSKAHGIFCAAYLWNNTIFFALYVINIKLFQENILIITGLGTAFII